jgi:hypothetical protein
VTVENRLVVIVERKTGWLRCLFDVLEFRNSVGVAGPQAVLAARREQTGPELAARVVLRLSCRPSHPVSTRRASSEKAAAWYSQRSLRSCPFRSAS